MLRCFRSGFPHTHAAIHMRFQVSIVHTIELSLGFQTPNLRGSRKSGCCGVQDHDVTWLPGALHKPNPTAEANSPKNFLSGNSREMVEIAQLLAGSRSIPASSCLITTRRPMGLSYVRKLPDSPLGARHAQLLDLVRNRATLLFDDPHPLDVLLTETFEASHRHPVEQCSDFALDVVVQRSPGLVEHVLA